VFEFRLLRTIIAPKRDEMTGDRRKLHNGEEKYFHSSSNIIKKEKIVRKSQAKMGG
jgi:hypothetical protein